MDITGTDVFLASGPSEMTLLVAGRDVTFDFLSDDPDGTLLMGAP